MTNQVKSKKRVDDYGEVFTNEQEVKAMCDLVSNECLRIDSRFLEPACGDGNFLAEILCRKLVVVAKRYKKNSYDYEKNALLALGSIYGVDIMSDNVFICRERLLNIWSTKYNECVSKKKQKLGVVDSARYIVEHNIICGNALSLNQVDAKGNDIKEPIIFSQWSFAVGSMVKREDYIFAELLCKKNEKECIYNSSQKTFSFDDVSQESQESQLIKVFPPIQYWRLKEYGR